MANSFRVYKMNADMIEVQTTTCIVRDIKEALQRTSGIHPPDIGLLVDGRELRNNATVSPATDLFLVIHSSFRAIALDFVINAQKSYGRACRRSWSKPENLATDEQVAQMSLEAANDFGRWARWGPAESPCLLECVLDAIPNYVQRCVGASVALEAEDERRKKNQDVYDRDILDLEEGEVPMKVILDYKERSWGPWGFGEEDAIAAARVREGRVQDLIESAMLRDWQSCEALGARHFAEQRGYTDGGFGWRQAIQANGRSAPLPSEQRVAILDLTSSEWVCQGVELLNCELDEAANRVIAEEIGRPEEQHVLVIEAMMSQRPHREALCRALMDSGAKAVGFVRSVAAALACQEVPNLVAVEVPSLVLTPVYEGFMICDAIMGSKDLPGLAAAHGQAIAACPVDTRRALRSHLLLYGSGAADFMGVDELKRLTGCNVRIGLSLALGADKLLNTCNADQLFVTREKYAAEGMAAVHRNCL